MSRGVFLLGVGVTLVGLGLAVTDRALSLLPGVTEANTRRIRVGMTRPQVEALLGGPSSFEVPIPYSFRKRLVWASERGEACVEVSLIGGAVERVWWDRAAYRTAFLPSGFVRQVRAWWRGRAR